MPTKVSGMYLKIDPKYAVEAIIQQVRKWKDEGQTCIVFDCLAIHPEADEDCTFGHLIDALPVQSVTR